MSSHRKFQNYSFVRHIVSSKNIKSTFLTSEPFPDDFSKVLFCSNQVNNGAFLCVEFHICQLNSLGKIESHTHTKKNHRSMLIRVLLITLNHQVPDSLVTFLKTRINSELR